MFMLAICVFQNEFDNTTVGQEASSMNARTSQTSVSSTDSSSGPLHTVVESKAADMSPALALPEVPLTPTASALQRFVSQLKVAFDTLLHAQRHQGNPPSTPSEARDLNDVLRCEN